MGLSDRERISMICSAVLIQITRVTETDGRTDGIGVEYARYSIYAVARKNYPGYWISGSQTLELNFVLVHWRDHTSNLALLTGFMCK